MGTRERLIDATTGIIQEKGIGAVTTKEIAEKTGVAEATIYRHFRDKTDLVLSALIERLPKHYTQLIAALPQRAGEASVQGNLEELMAAALDFFTQTVTFNAAVAADPELAARHTERMRELGQGPEVSQKAVLAYLQAEQRLGRLRADASPAAATLILLTVPYGYAQARYVMGPSDQAILPADQFTREIVQTMLNGLITPSNK